jgi:hypothetical protein
LKKPIKKYKLIGPDGEVKLSSKKGVLGGYHRGSQKLYGRLDCPSALRWIAKGHYVNYRVFFASEEDALAAGFRPCKICKPDVERPGENDVKKVEVKKTKKDASKVAGNGKLVAKEKAKDSPKPSTCVDGYWMYVVSSKIDRNKINTEFCGKWLLFFDESVVDEHWARIAKAVKSGKLGISAKVVTAMGHFVNSGYDPKNRVVCVYTLDFRDREDVMKVRGGLRRLGYDQLLRYKTDQATREGLYDDDSYMIDEVASGM